MIERIKILRIFIPVFILLASTSYSIFNSSKDITQFQLLTLKTNFEAGEIIHLKFFSEEDTPSALSIKGSYGTTILFPQKKNDTLLFEFPDFITEKTGEVHWKFFQKNTERIGTISIQPKAGKTFLESYFGPRTIIAGGNDYSMLSVIPTDIYDNPLQDSTLVNINYEFLGYQTESKVATEHFIAWKNIYSRDLAGNILVASNYNGTSSKELLTEIYPSNATDFTITAERNHQYADGNQICTFKSSVIKDAYGNIIADGTFVEFFIWDKNNTVLKTSGNTIKGVATAKMLHPDSETEWRIKAYVTGFAESNEVTLSYLPVMDEFPIKFSKDGRTIKIGPLKSFMGQLIPDGAVVSLKILNTENQLIELKKDTSFEGVVEFYLKSDFYPDNTYHFELECAGIQKKASNVRLW